MKCFIKLCIASLSLDWYLLRHGMWRGEKRFAGYRSNNRIAYLAAVTGSIARRDIKSVRVFWDDYS